MTIRKNNKSITYTLDNRSRPQGHSLGVNALDYSVVSRNLVSAGRDGVVGIWEASQGSPSLSNYWNSEKVNRYLSENIDNEHEIMALESRLDDGLRLPKPSTNAHKLSNYKQLHSDWINDIKFIDPHKIASCSSDGSVKVWDYESDHVTTIGWHEDYAKKLVHSDKGLVTGGLDKRIISWDLAKAQENFSFRDTCSIYALDAYNCTVASGGTDAVIKLLDSRTGEFTAHLIGHVDTVRSLILRDNQILSGSSDGSIKLWCRRMNRVQRNFEFHDSSVWSLHCPEEYGLDYFYSGDKNGVVIKTDLRSCNYQLSDDYLQNKLNQGLGVSCMVSSGESGVLGLVSDSESIWSCSGDAGRGENNFISRFQDIDTTDLALFQAIKFSKQFEFQQNENELYDLVSQLSHDYAEDQWHSIETPQGQTCFVNFKGGPSVDFLVRLREKRKLHVDVVYDRLVPSLLVPLSTQPLEVLQGHPGIITSQVMNNRRIILTMNNVGVVQKWDLIKCRLIETIDPPPSCSQDELRDFFQDVCDQNQTMETLPQWCKISLKMGKILVTLNESSFLNTEIYSDELFQVFPELTQFYDTHHKGQVDDSVRFNVGKIMLRNLFEPFIEYEVSKRKQSHDAAKGLRKMFTRKASSESVVKEDTVLSVIQETSDFHTNPDLEVPLVDINTENLLVIVSLHDGRELLSFHYEQMKASDHTLFESLETALPRWCGESLLVSKYPPVDLAKVGFQLLPTADTKLPNISNGTKLSAYNMVRVKKVLGFIAERFDHEIEEMAAGIPIDQWLELYCNGKRLDNKMTLATVKTKVWKRSGDVELVYNKIEL